MGIFRNWFECDEDGTENHVIAASDPETGGGYLSSGRMISFNSDGSMTVHGNDSVPTYHEDNQDIEPY